MKITNNSGITLPLAVWLLHDEYDFVRGVKNYISVTTLMRPVRQIVLPGRIPSEEREADVSEFIARKLGHAIHDSIDKAWTIGYERSLQLLGYPAHIIDRVRINPTDEELIAKPDIIPIYLEQRGLREIGDATIGGKFDMVTEGIVNDTKSTSVWGWIKGTREDEHQLQMSLYRWIDAARARPRITEDYGQVNYIFTDWSKNMVRSIDNYPPQRVMEKQVPLLSLVDTEHWIRWKLAEIAKYQNLPESQIPECTDEELWRSDPQYKYYADPTKTAGKSTKNFTSLADANAHMASKGGKGIVITKPGEVKACGYCPAFRGCTQKDKYL